MRGLLTYALLGGLGYAGWYKFIRHPNPGETVSKLRLSSPAEQYTLVVSPGASAMTTPDQLTQAIAGLIANAGGPFDLQGLPVFTPQGLWLVPVAYTRRSIEVSSKVDSDGDIHLPWIPQHAPGITIQEAIQR